MKTNKLPPLDQILKALADPVRLCATKQLLLDKEKEMACGTFDYDVSKATFSHHIKILVDAQILSERIEGTRKFLSINKNTRQAYPELFQIILKD